MTMSTAHAQIDHVFSFLYFDPVVSLALEFKDSDNQGWTVILLDPPAFLAMVIYC